MNQPLMCKKRDLSRKIKYLITSIFIKNEFVFYAVFEEESPFVVSLKWIVDMISQARK